MISLNNDGLDYQKLFNLWWEQTDNLLLLLSADLIITQINLATEKMFRWNASQVIGKNINTVLEEQLLDPIITDDMIVKNTSTLIYNNNHKLTINWTITPSYNLKTKNPIYLVIGKIEYLKIQTELVQLENVMKFAPGLLYWKDTNSVYLGCNDEFARLAGLKSRHDVKGKTDFDLVWHKSAEHSVAVDKRVIASGNAQLDHVEIIAVSNEKKITVITNKVPMRDYNNQIIGVLGITIDITHQKEIELALSIAKEQAETANKAKTEFIANMSHDIRTPLSGVIGLSEILEQSLESNIQKEQAQMLHNSGEELLVMLNSILDDVRAEHLTDENLEEKTFDVHQCLNDLVRLELPTTTLKNLKLSVIIDEQVPQYIISDRKKIHRILLNLLGNAIKFTPSGRIVLGIKCMNKTASKVELRFSVADTGIGIPKKLQRKIFERFFRGTSSYKGQHKGHGLGLHIAQSYVRLLGGHIALTSIEDIGSTFYFDISCCWNKPYELQQSNDKIQTRSVLTEHGIKPHLLLVEDNIIALKVLETLVHSKGYTFQSTDSGEKAQELAKTVTFDLIITDIGLPGISGYQLTQNIRAWERMHDKNMTPIVGLTGHAKEEANQKCIISGMNDVYSKPITPQLLQEIVSIYYASTNLQQPEPLQSSTELKLGADLPQMEEELFQLDAYALFDPQDALQKINNMALVIELVKNYLSDTIQTDIKAIKTAQEKNNWEDVEKKAHKVKGGVSYIGTHRLRYACQFLERYIKAGYAERKHELVKQVISINQQTVNVLQKWLDNYDQ